MYYPHTVRSLNKALIKEYPSIEPRSLDDGGGLISHLLWMLEQIEQMNRKSIEDAVKAGRWLGWILRTVEYDLGLWTNNFSQDIVREDVAHGYDVPH